MPLDRGESRTTERVHVARERIGGDLRVADDCRAGRDPGGERVVEADGCRDVEHVDHLLQPLVRGGQRGELDAERAREDLVAEADREQRPPCLTASCDDLLHPPHPRRARIPRVAGAGAGDDELGAVDLLVRDLAPRDDLHGEAEVAQLVGEHRGEPVLGIHDDRRASLERSAGGEGVLRVEPEGSQPRIA